MGRFYFHLKDGDDLTLDEEGSELPGIDAARKEALRTAREMLSEAIKQGAEKVWEALVIADASGRTIEVLPLAAALPMVLRARFS
jgi:hypothetical protein